MGLYFQQNESSHICPLLLVQKPGYAGDMRVLDSMAEKCLNFLESIKNNHHQYKNNNNNVIKALAIAVGDLYYCA